MKYYGIFDQNNNYKLLRYSTDEQSGNSYTYTDPVSKTLVTVNEICLPEIDYSEDYIGKFYNLETQIFFE
jgi:hypothetical protein